jgi:hypothetical protein
MFFLIAGAAGDLAPATLSAFDQYAGRREGAIQGEVRDPSRFLFIDRWSEAQKQKAYADLRAGRVVVDSGKRTDVKDGIIHHWTGAVFIPGANLQQTLRFVQDYNNVAKHYQPDLQSSRLLGRSGNTFRIQQRYHKKKVITVILDTEHEVRFLDGLPAGYAASIGHTTRISEVENPGTASEKRLPPGQGTGFLWKLNSYWRFAERDGGVYVQCETLSLTRDIPFGLAWAVGRFVNSVPRESLDFTLRRTRQSLAKG